MANIFLDNSLLFALTQIVPVLYIATTVLYGLHFFRELPLAGKLKQPALILTIVTHIADIGLLTSIEGYRLSYSAYNLMGMVALTLTITYMFIELTTKSDKTGFFVIAFAAGSALLSSILSAKSIDAGPAFSGLRIGVHLIAAIFGFSSVAIAGLYSGLYLILFRQIRLNRFGLLFQRLPNLEALELLIMHAVAFGFFFLTITIVAGVLEQHASQEAIKLLDPRLISIVVIWLLYGISLFIKPLFGWDIKHMAVLLIATFVLVTAFLFIMSLITPSFHGGGV
ncbi:cytochrome c assembly protein [Chlorobaculum parvum NCIB 8327]|uniref:Cytochrome c assembly protein n=1 Tax=Chlorobaculum parvum (strain DSM 263 / NCIMB 8327) TaxID=517417 RepID=B3QMK3_CHLP8|nr:cytochrome c biogenesis protein CcsA [Chlorobaculum parvum]ACF11156.1 cytochrome c assembly protein [Chlorobaculum parvum NCIB 8327]